MQNLDHQPDDRHANAPLGIAFALAEILLMLAISIMVKLVSPQVDTITVLLYRYALCLPLLLATALWRHGRLAFAITAPGTLCVRIVAGLLGLSFFYAALDLMSLAKVTVLFQTVTLFVTLFAPFLLGERTGWRRWTAVIIGFGGTLVLLEPGVAGWNAQGVFFAIGSPFFGAIMLIMLRRLGQRDSPAATSVWYNGAGFLVFLGLVIGFDATLPDMREDFLLLAMIGVLSSFQQLFLAFSHSLAKASLLASLRYLSIPAGIAAGIVFFDERLTSGVVVGSAIVIASSVFIVWRERQLRRSG